MTVLPVPVPVQESAPNLTAVRTGSTAQSRVMFAVWEAAWPPTQLNEAGPKPPAPTSTALSHFSIHTLVGHHWFTVPCTWMCRSTPDAAPGVPWKVVWATAMPAANTAPVGVAAADSVPAGPDDAVVATRLDEGGISSRQVADQLGHAKPSMTLDVNIGRTIVSADAARLLDR
ncbi:hypothetical protein [uncultured Jatrophihabitans sp.]|uniref:hypothetical protein n=1 Tax=uncultured Jatrophihabitans sp. TaxID=1610747 RepID=UPI0035CB9C89